MSPDNSESHSIKIEVRVETPLDVFLHQRRHSRNLHNLEYRAVYDRISKKMGSNPAVKSHSEDRQDQRRKGTVIYSSLSEGSEY
jgi:hypothetical protein